MVVEGLTYERLVDVDGLTYERLVDIEGNNPMKDLYR
jgi:hypothetical protein